MILAISVLFFGARAAAVDCFQEGPLDGPAQYACIEGASRALDLSGPLGQIRHSLEETQQTLPSHILGENADVCML